MYKCQLWVIQMWWHHFLQMSNRIPAPRLSRSAGEPALSAPETPPRHKGEASNRCEPAGSQSIGILGRSTSGETGLKGRQLGRPLFCFFWDIYICIYVYIYVYMYIYVYIYMYIYIYIYQGNRVKHISRWARVGVSVPTWLLHVAKTVCQSHHRVVTEAHRSHLKVCTRCIHVFLCGWMRSKWFVASGKLLQKTMERSTIFHGENPLFLWPFSIAILT